MKQKSLFQTNFVLLLFDHTVVVCFFFHSSIIGSKWSFRLQIKCLNALYREKNVLQITFAIAFVMVFFFFFQSMDSTATNHAYLICYRFDVDHILQKSITSWSLSLTTSLSLSLRKNAQRNCSQWEAICFIVVVLMFLRYYAHWKRIKLEMVFVASVFL